MKKTWNYVSKDAQRNTLTGTVNAADEEEAILLLQRMGNSDVHIIGEEGQKPTVKASIPPAKTPQVPAAQATAQENLNRFAAAMSQDVAKLSQKPAEGRSASRRQSVFVGDQVAMRKWSEPLLDIHNGKVVMASMHPDLQGRMCFLLVVEHEREIGQ